jgi:hypothetical protein
MSITPLVHESLAEIHENKLVDRIVTDILWGREFFQFYGMPPGMTNRQCVPLHSAPGNPKGDIDVLFCTPDLPQRAVAYQIKRVKCGIHQLRNGTLGKLREFKKLSQQANLLAQMGFWQVYAYAIVVVDAREQNAREQSAEKVTFQGLSSEMRSKVESAVSSATQLFDARVGFGVMDFIQTMDSAPFTVGTHGLHVRRFSEPTEQSKELTDWVARIFSI